MVGTVLGYTDNKDGTTGVRAWDGVVTLVLRSEHKMV